jgi:hypothetical protein
MDSDTPFLIGSTILQLLGQDDRTTTIMLHGSNVGDEVNFSGSLIVQRAGRTAIRHQVTGISAEEMICRLLDMERLRRCPMCRADKPASRFNRNGYCMPCHALRFALSRKRR